MKGGQTLRPMTIAGAFLIAWGLIFALLFWQGSAECDPTNGCEKYHSPVWFVLAALLLCAGTIASLLSHRGNRARQGNGVKGLKEPEPGNVRKAESK